MARVRKPENSPPETPPLQAQPAVEIGLSAAIVSVHAGQPQILTVRPGAGGHPLDGLPSGAFSPVLHRTLEIGLRSWVKEQTGLDLGYVEQLYTFGDRGRHARPGDTGPHIMSIGYLALARASDTPCFGDAVWQRWYDYFPWEDWRHGKPRILAEHIIPRLKVWSRRPRLPGAPERPLSRAERLHMCFGVDRGWDEEKVLERYELLYEAGLVAEARNDGRESAGAWGTSLPELGRPMRYDHRRILATAMSRLRGKIKYRPVIFELMPEVFTLYALQRTVEAILGSHLHKQNFRRLVESAGLVEPTGTVDTATGGRPARLYRFRREVLLERPAPGVRVRASQSGA